MNGAVGDIRNQADAELESFLRERVRGDVQFDPLARTIYATDASMYQIIPRAVVRPKDVPDVVAVVGTCRELGVSIVPRGAGTGLTGGAVGPGVQLDLSRYMNHIGRLDVAARTIDVEPGVVLDDLNTHLRPHGLQFAPDVATSSRATIGGMIANNSCGAHSVIYGRTVDHVNRLRVALSDDEVVTFDRTGVTEGTSGSDARGRAISIESELSQIRDDCYDEIRARFPRILRSNGGYGLDRLGSVGGPADVVGILCGSEGTLGVVVGATLKLIPIEPHRGLVILCFDDLFDALGATPLCLQHDPAAVELVDRLIIEAGRANPSVARGCKFLEGAPAAMLVVEFFGDSADNVSSQCEALANVARKLGGCSAAHVELLADRQRDVWNLRKAGLGLLMSKPGDAQPHAFVEDSAVDPSRLREYIGRFAVMLEREGVRAGYYAHASVGCIHVRPIINLKRADDIAKMRRIAESVSELALEFGGAMTGEHGDGIVRSCWLEKTYGPRIIAAFSRVKKLFDPTGLFNPHKIVDPWDMTEHLRFGPSYSSRPVKTHLDFSMHGGMAGLAEMCSGVGDCRKRNAGTMCPSYMATLAEEHTTRARANALRAALSHRGLLDGLDDPSLEQVMDLCIGCKACKAECPTGVDMARLKVEYLAHRNLRVGVSKRARMIADLPDLLSWAARFPRIANALLQSHPWRALMERRYGLDRRIAPPRLARQSFRAWFRRHRRRRSLGSAPRGRVVYFVDTWTNHCTPQVGIAAVTLLERAGFDVLCPVTRCCGRPAISQGLLGEAKQQAEMNTRRLASLAGAGVPIVGTEPSCLLTLTDEYPQLLRSTAARTVASQSVMLETFLRRLLDDEPTALSFRQRSTPLRYHAHCHQKALVGSDDAMTLLHFAFGESATQIDSGCCGMAGAFGHEVEHYDIAHRIGEDRLFPAVRNRGDADVAVSGFSCKTQIAHHTDATPRHLVEHLADALEPYGKTAAASRETGKSGNP